MGSKPGKIRSVRAGGLSATAAMIGGAAAGLTNGLASIPLIVAIGAFAGLAALTAELSWQRHELQRVATSVREEAWIAAISSLTPPSRQSAGASVTDLLRPEYGIVPFHHLREPDLRILRRWATDDLATPVWLVVGPGGVGKTRLACQLGHELTKQGWRCGFVREGREVAAVDAARRMFDATLLIVDYSEARTELSSMIEALIGEVAEERERIRIIIIARERGEWWERLAHSDHTTRKFVAAAGCTKLGPLTGDIAISKTHFREAVHAFARALGAADIEAELETDDLDAPILRLHAAALLAIIRAQRPSPRMPSRSGGDVLAELLAHEVYYWSGLAKSHGLVDLQVATQRKAVTLAALFGPSARLTTIEMLRRIPEFIDAPVERLSRIAGWLRDLYPSANEEGVGQIQPDLIAEALVVDTLAADENLARTALTNLPADAAPRAVTVLARSAEHRPRAVGLLDQVIRSDPSRMLFIGLDVAVQTAGPIDAVLAAALAEMTPTLEEVVRLEIAIPEGSAAVAKSAVVLAQHRLSLSYGDQARASALEALAIRLASAGALRESLVHLQEAVQLWQRIVTAGGKHRPAYARTLLNLGVALARAGRQKDALRAKKRAVTAYRKVANDDPKRRWDLAVALNSEGITLLESGKPRDALAAHEEALAIFRRSTADSIQRCADLASALAAMGRTVSEFDRLGDALALQTEAVMIFRDLANRDSKYSTILAKELRNTAITLSAKMACHQEALPIAREAIAILRTLVAFDPEARLDLAHALSILGIALHFCGKYGEARENQEEAVRIYRTTIAVHPEHRKDLAAALAALALSLSAQGHQQEAVSIEEETVAIYRQLTSDVHNRVSLGRALGNMAVSLIQLDREAEAIPVLAEAVAIFQQLAKADPRHLEDFASSLVNSATLQQKVGRQDVAIETMMRASRIYRKLAEINAERFRVQLATVNSTVRDMLRQTGREEDAMTFGIGSG